MSYRTKWTKNIQVRKTNQNSNNTQTKNIKELERQITERAVHVDTLSRYNYKDYCP